MQTKINGADHDALDRLDVAYREIRNRARDTGGNFTATVDLEAGTIEVEPNKAPSERKEKPPAGR